jgi:hypothetical protein
MKTNYTQTSREYRRQQEQLRNAAPDLLEALQAAQGMIFRMESDSDYYETNEAFLLRDKISIAIETATH